MGFRTLATVLALVLLVAACTSEPVEEQSAEAGQAGDDEDDEEDQDSAGDASEPGTVRIAAGEDRWADDEGGAASTLFAYPPNVNIYEPLIRMGSDYSLQPALAEDWELIDGETFRFHLREDVTWHDGSEFTADDVVWSWGERQLEGEGLSTLATTLDEDSVEKVDEYTVDITPAQTNMRVFQQIVHPSGSIVPEGRHMDSDPPIGTGPFQFVEYNPEQNVVVERFDDYWGDPAQVERMEWQFLPDAQTRIEALRAGQVDLIMDLPPESVDSFEEDDEFRVAKSPAGKMMTIFINKSGEEPHDLGADEDIREAISLAIDQEALVGAAFDGHAEPGRWMTPGELLGDSADDVPPPTFDPDQAAEILEDNGWEQGSDGVRERNGERLELDLIGWPEVSLSTFQVVQAQLGEVGMDVEIKHAPDFPTWSNYFQEQQFDLDIRVGNQNDANPSFIPVLIFSERFAGTDVLAPGEHYEEVVDEALEAETEEELQQAAAELMRILIHEDHIVVPLAGVHRIYGMTSDVELADPHGSWTSQDWTTLSVE